MIGISDGEPRPYGWYIGRVNPEETLKQNTLRTLLTVREKWRFEHFKERPFAGVSFSEDF